MKELKRILFCKKTVIAFLLLISASVGIFAYGEIFNSEDLDFRKCNYYYRTELDSIADNDISSASAQIEDKLMHTSILTSLVKYEKIKTDRYEEYTEYWLDEELKLRAEYPEYAEEYDKTKKSLNLTELYAYEASLSEIANQIDYISSYPQYLDSIDAKAKQMRGIAVFSEANPLSDKNINKTVEDYGKLKSVTLSIGNDKPLTAVLEFEAVHWLILAFILFLIFTFTEERKISLNTLVFSTSKGRSKLALKRANIIFIAVAAVNIVVYGLLFAESFIIYGSDNIFSRAVQSIEYFKYFTVPLTEFEFILFYVMINIIVDFAIAFTVWLITNLINNRSLALGVVGVFFGVEYLLYAIIPHQSNFALLRYVNIYCFINPTEAITQYSNINAYVTVLNRLGCTIISAIVLTLIFAVLSIVVYANKYPNKTLNRFEIMLCKFFAKVKDLYWILIENLTALGVEIYKLLIIQKGLVVISVLALVLFSFTTVETIFYSSADSIVNDFYAKCSGPISEDTFVYVENLEREIAVIDNEWEQACEDYAQGAITYDKYRSAKLKNDAFDSKRQAVQIISERIDYANTSEFEAYIVNPRGYEKLIGQDGYIRRQIYALASVFSVIIIFSGTFAFEKQSGMRQSLRTYSKGGSILFIKKLISVSLICAVVLALSVCAELYDVCGQFSLEVINAPVKSLEFFSDFSLNPPIAVFIVLMYLIRYLVLLATAFSVCFISTKTRYEICILISTVVFVLPSLFYLAGVSFMGTVSLSYIIGFTEFVLNSGVLSSVLLIGTVFSVGVICTMLARHSWCGKSRKIHGTDY